MLQIVGVVDDKYRVLDTDDGVEDLVSAEDLVLNISIGVEFDGCEYGPKGLCVWYAGVEPYDVDVEVWKPVSVYNVMRQDGRMRYEVSNLGRVRSLGKAVNYIKIIILEPAVTAKGYRMVGLSVSNKTRTFSVHRLVAMEFVPNPLGLETVNHKDEDKSNNSAYNLSWMSNADNVRYGTGSTRSAEARYKIVRQYGRDGCFIREYESVKVAAAAVGAARTELSHCCRRVPGHYTCKGFIWRYAYDDEFYGLDAVERGDSVLRVRQYDVSYKFIAEFTHRADIERIYGFDMTSILSCCTGHRGTSYGFVWRYSTDDEFECINGNRALIEEFRRTSSSIDMAALVSKAMQRVGGRRGFVRQYTLDGVFLAEYRSTTDAEKATGKSHSAIVMNCSGKIKRGRQFLWRWSDNDEFADRPGNRALIEEFHRKQAEQE